CDRRAKRPHAERNDVHRPAAHAAVEQAEQGFAHLRRGRPVVGGTPSSSLSEQMKVRSSTRATSDGCERARYELGRLSGLRRMSVPAATISAQIRLYSSAEPSAQ